MEKQLKLLAQIILPTLLTVLKNKKKAQNLTRKLGKQYKKLNIM